MTSGALITARSQHRQETDFTESTRSCDLKGSRGRSTPQTDYFNRPGVGQNLTVGVGQKLSVANTARRGS